MSLQPTELLSIKFDLLSKTLLLLKHNKSIDHIAQANTHTQTHRNNAKNEIVTSTVCLALYCIFPPRVIQCIWMCKNPFSYK